MYPETEPGILMCKNNHKYQAEDLFPLRPTEFEGTKVKIPYSYLPILEEEYTTMALVQTDFHDHHWDRERKEWVQGAEDLSAHD